MIAKEWQYRCDTNKYTVHFSNPGTTALCLYSSMECMEECIIPGGGTSIYPATDCAAQEGMLFSDLAVSERVSYLHYMSQVSEGVSNLRLLGYLVSQRVSNIHMGKNSQFRRIPNKKNSE